MSYKICLLTALFCVQGFVGSAHAETSPPRVSKPVQFYLGVAGGVERMSGRRSESLNEESAAAAGVRVISVYSDNRRMTENNPSLSGMAGFVWKLPSVPVMMGPEVFLGRGTTLSSLKDTRLDTTPENRFYMTDFQRKTFYGALVRLGFQFCQTYFTYLSVGVDRAQFSITRAIANDQGNVPTTRAQYTKWFNGFLLGVGFEKTIASLKVGIDLRMVNYRKRSFGDSMNVAPGIAPALLSFSARPVVYSAGLRISYLF